MSECSLGIIHGPEERKASVGKLQVAKGQTFTVGPLKIYDQGYNHAIERTECCFGKLHRLPEAKVKDRAEAEENFKLPYTSMLCDLGYEHKGCSAGEFHKPGDKRGSSSHAFFAREGQEYPVSLAAQRNGLEWSEPPTKVCDEGFEHRKFSLGQYHHGEPTKEDRERTQNLCKEYGIASNGLFVSQDLLKESLKSKKLDLPIKPKFASNPQLKKHRIEHPQLKKFGVEPEVKIPRQTCNQGYAHAVRCNHGVVHYPTDRKPAKGSHPNFSKFKPKQLPLDRRLPPRAMDNRLKSLQLDGRSRGLKPSLGRGGRLEDELAPKPDPWVTCEQGFLHKLGPGDMRLCSLRAFHPRSSQHPTPAVDSRSVSTPKYTVCNQGCRHGNSDNGIERLMAFFPKES